MSKRGPITSDSQAASSSKKTRLDDNYDACLACEDYTVGWLCAIQIEFVAACAFLDEKHPRPAFGLGGDNTAYSFGRMGEHNVVIAVLPKGDYGIASAAVVATHMYRSFPNLRVPLMVGIGGGAPSLQHDICLGDVVVSVPKNGTSGIFQYDFGKAHQDRIFQQTGSLNQPPELLRGAVSLLNAEYRPHMLEEMVTRVLQERPEIEADCKRPPLSSDVLYRPDVVHPPGSEIKCDEVCGQDSSRFETRSNRRKDEEMSKIHYGLIASANQVMRDASIRDKLVSQRDVLCFEMEAAGLMNSAKPYLIIRGICDYSDSHKKKEWQGYAAMIAAAYARSLLRHIPRQVVIERNIIKLSYRGEKDDQSSQSKHRQSEPLNDDQIHALLDSLRFDQIDARRLTIKKAHTKTCKWFLKQSQYLSWLQNCKLPEHHGFLWIRGKPGAGKSTLMKFVLDSSKRTAKDAVIISFFFNARGNELEKSTIGMYRSLVLQLLQSIPTLQSVLGSVELHGNTSYQWTVESLKDIFEQAILKLDHRSLICFIDALDEADADQVRDMISFFEQIGELAVSAGIQFRSCFASRHYPHISLKKGVEMTLEAQEGHSQDITTYLNSELRIGDGQMAGMIRDQMQDKSSGVFLWVVLVVDILNKDHDTGQIPSQLKKKIENIPGDLHTLFRNIILRDAANKEGMLLCIQWVLFARRPLNPAELYFAIFSGINSEALNQTDPIEVTISVAERYNINISKGLVEITKSNNPTVQFIHESVRDFLLKENGFKELWPELGDKPVGKSHDKMKDCCLKYMTTFDVGNALKIEETILEDDFRSLASEEAATFRQSAEQAFPFMQYATQNILYHSNIAQGEGIDQLSFLNHFQPSGWIRLDNLFEKHRIRRHTKDASLLYILAEHNLANLIKRHPDKLNGFKRENERYGIPMLAASATGSREAGQALLQAHVEDPASISYSLHEQYYNETYKLNPTRNFSFPRERTIISIFADYGDNISASYYLLSEKEINKVGIDFKDGSGQTPLSLAAENGHDAVVKLLLEIGKVDVDSRDDNSRTPLSYAAGNGQNAVVKLLLETGKINVNSGGYYGRTPLSYAAINGHNITVKLLLETEKVDADSRDDDSRTPLSLAAENGHDVVVKLLLEIGKVDVNSRDDDSRTPLSYAAGNGQNAVVKLLLEIRKVNVDSRDHYGETPLSYAVRFGHNAIVELLLETGKVNVNSGGYYGRTPLSYAAANGHNAIVKLLLETGKVDINSRDDDSRTPLSCAAANGHNIIVKLLLETGKVNVDSEDSSGRTPLSWAAQQGHDAVFKLLRVAKMQQLNSCSKQ